MQQVSSERGPAPTGSPRIDIRRLRQLADRATRGEGEREPIEVENPATGRPLAAVPRCNADDIELAVNRQVVKFSHQLRHDAAGGVGAAVGAHDEHGNEDGFPAGEEDEIGTMWTHRVDHPAHDSESTRWRESGVYRG